jgi:hypothetical protein
MYPWEVVHIIGATPQSRAVFKFKFELSHTTPPHAIIHTQHPHITTTTTQQHDDDDRGI